MHALMGEADAEVNLVAGDEGEAVDEYEHEHENEYEYQHECEYEGLWVGTLGAIEVPREINESADTNAVREPAQCEDQAKAGEEMNQYEYEYEDLWVGTIGVTEVLGKADRSADVTAGQGPAQDGDPVEMEEEAAGDEQWDLETDRSDWRADGARVPLHEPSHRPPQRPRAAAHPDGG